jgi:hypothetical protein
MYKSLFVLGGILAATGIVFYVPTIGQPHPEAVMAMSSLLFSGGALLVAAGFYLRARHIQSELPVATTNKKNGKLCASCNREPAIVFCRVHLQRLCTSCFDTHDDGKNCLYVPAKRAAAAYK